MALQLSLNPRKNNFTAHGEGYVAVNQQPYTRPIVVTPEAVHTDWNARSFKDLTVADFEYLLALKPELVLFGTGKKQHFPLATLIRPLIDAHISIEFMDTPAACRTFNILVAEDRNVMAAVLL